MRALHLETDLFEFWDDETEYRQGQFENPRGDLVDMSIDGQNAVQPGESFAHWLKDQLSNLPFEFDEPIGEDWGWGFFAVQEKEKFWIALSFAGVTDNQSAGCWVVSVDPQRGLMGLFRKKKPELLAALWSGVAAALENTPGIRITLRE